MVLRAPRQPRDLHVHLVRQLTLMTLMDTETQVSLRNFCLEMLVNYKIFL